MAEKENEKRFSPVSFNPMTSLLAVLNSNDESDTNVVLAKYFLDNFSRLKSMSIYQVATDCYTSRSSVQRFIKAIGYDTFTALKESAAEVMEHQKSFHTYADHTDFANYLQTSVDNMMVDINNMAQQQRLIRLAERIHDSRNVFILNAEDSSSAARYFQQQMLSMNKLIRLVTSSTSTNPHILKSLEKEDCLIACSATGNFALIVNEDIVNVKAYRCLVTLNRTLLFQDKYDTIFYLSERLQPNHRTLLKLRNVYTRYGMAYFFDLLFHLYFARYQNELRPD